MRYRLALLARGRFLERPLGIHGGGVADDSDRRWRQCRSGGPRRNRLHRAGKTARHAGASHYGTFSFDRIAPALRRRRAHAGRASIFVAVYGERLRGTVRSVARRKAATHRIGASHCYDFSTVEEGETNLVGAGDCKARRYRYSLHPAPNRPNRWRWTRLRTCTNPSEVIRPSTS